VCVCVCVCTADGVIPLLGSPGLLPREAASLLL